ncbi:hypothetical protein Tco_0595095 [Tanacetum coccineum]
MKDVRYQLNTLSRQERCTYEHVVLASTCHWETATTVRKPPRMGRISKNLLDRVSAAVLAVFITRASQTRQHDTIVRLPMEHNIEN